MERIFRQRKQELLAQWTNTVYKLYSLEMTSFVQRTKDRFANPVGYATDQSLGTLYDAVTGEDIDEAQVRFALTDIIRIRAVQDFKPSAAIGILYLIKPLLRKLADTDAVPYDVIHMAEDRVDALVLMAVDLYIEDKDAMMHGRVDEIRRRYKTIERWIAAQGMEGLIPENL